MLHQFISCLPVARIGTLIVSAAASRQRGEGKKHDVLQIRTTTKRNDFSRRASVSNQSSSRSESKLTEWCHNASPRAPPGRVASRSLSDSNTGVLSPQLWCSDPVCSHFRAFHRWCLSGGHVHFWRDAGFRVLSQRDAANEEARSWHNRREISLFFLLTPRFFFFFSLLR